MSSRTVVRLTTDPVTCRCQLKPTRENHTVSACPSNIAAITLFVDDLGSAKDFYQEVFGLPVSFEDPDSIVFKFGDTLINLLTITAAGELIQPAPVGRPGLGNRFQFTVAVEDVDATCEALQARGVTLLNGPMDRPWGVRTASFQDPAGHIWEIAR